MEFKNILVPMDFSACAKNAYRFALEFADRAGSQLHLVTVTHMPHMHAEIMGAAAIVEPLLEDVQEQIERQFKELQEEFPSGKVMVTNSQYHAPLHNAIYSSILQKNIDLIITGTRSQHDWLEFALGSNSSDMVKRSKVPVLVIPENARPATFERIGVAIDYSDFSDPVVLEPLRDFARLYHSKMCLLNVTTKHHKLFVYDDIKVIISEYFKGLRQSYHTYTDSRTLNEILLEAIKDLDLKMLFMLPKNHSILHRMIKTSQTKAMTLRIDVPLMTIHEKQPK